MIAALPRELEGSHPVEECSSLPQFERENQPRWYLHKQYPSNSALASRSTTARNRGRFFTCLGVCSYEGDIEINEFEPFYGFSIEARGPSVHNDACREANTAATRNDMASKDVDSLCASLYLRVGLTAVEGSNSILGYIAGVEAPE